MYPSFHPVSILLFHSHSQFDPVVQRGNEGLVHHFVVMVCGPNFPEKYVNVSADCNDKANMPDEVLGCQYFGRLMAAWGIGGGVSKTETQGTEQ